MIPAPRDKQKKTEVDFTFMLVKSWIIGKPQIDVFTDVAIKGRLTDKCWGKKTLLVFDAGKMAIEARQLQYRL